jgi:hypothetical protein
VHPPFDGTHTCLLFQWSPSYYQFVEQESHLLCSSYPRTHSFLDSSSEPRSSFRTYLFQSPFFATVLDFFFLSSMLLSFKPLDFYPQRCNALTLSTLLMPSLAAGLRLFGNVSFLKLGAILFQMILRSAFVTTGERLTPWKPSVVQNSFLLSEEFLL